MSWVCISAYVAVYFYLVTCKKFLKIVGGRPLCETHTKDWNFAVHFNWDFYLHGFPTEVLFKNYSSSKFHKKTRKSLASNGIACPRKQCTAKVIRLQHLPEAKKVIREQWGLVLASKFLPSGSLETMYTQP